LQVIMNDLVGLIRRESEMKTALVELDKLRAREARVSVADVRACDPGWHLALDLRNMLEMAECSVPACPLCPPVLSAGGNPQFGALFVWPRRLPGRVMIQRVCWACPSKICVIVD
jgi:Fumarate reductase flavoprotein C-term